MARQTDFAVFLNRFLTDYLPNKRGSSQKLLILTGIPSFFS